MAWTAMSGVLTWRADEALLEAGRGIYHGTEDREPRTRASELTVVRHRVFGAYARPWRCAWVNLLDDGGGPVGAEADELDAGTRDYLDIRGMLDPSPLSEVVELPGDGTFRVPGSSVEEDLTLLPGLVALGSDYYEAELRQELGIIVSWTAVIGGAVASQLSVEPTWWA